jgi:hypothetical protein
MAGRHVLETTQIAPTIIQLMGLDPHKLQAVHSRGHTGSARHRLVSVIAGPMRAGASILGA